jgi:hypothetical protein
MSIAAPRLGHLNPPAWHRPWFRYIEPVEGAEASPPADPAPKPEPPAEKSQDKTFSQADLDRIVRERLAQQARTQFGDYEELKSKAGVAKTLEDRVGSLESDLAASRSNALRTRIAAEFGISTKKGDKGEPSDADLFLTGTDEATLTAQAQRLSGLDADKKRQQANVVPKEGPTKTTDPGDEELREFARGLFGRPE